MKWLVHKMLLLITKTLIIGPNAFTLPNRPVALCSEAAAGEPPTPRFADCSESAAAKSLVLEGATDGELARTQACTDNAYTHAFFCSYRGTWGLFGWRPGEKFPS